MVKFSSLRTDPVKTEDGVWIPWLHGIKCRLAMYGNTKFQNRLLGLRQPHVDVAGRISDEAAEEIMFQSLAETIFLDFDGFDQDDGTPLENTLENRLMLLRDPGLRHFADWVSSASQNIQWFLMERAATLSAKS